MSLEKYIPVHQLCTHYQVEVSFFTQLNEVGLIDVQMIEESLCIHHEKIKAVEKMIRLHSELNLNLEGIDTVMNLLEKIEDLQAELTTAKNRLRFFED